MFSPQDSSAVARGTVLHPHTPKTHECVTHIRFRHDGRRKARVLPAFGIDTTRSGAIPTSF